MKISPDGSLPRITSSSKGITRCVQIVPVPDDEVKEDGLYFKLAWIGPVESECDSEKSEEELWSDDDIPNVELSVGEVPNNQPPLKDKEKVKDVESQTESHTQVNNPKKFHYGRRYKNRDKRFRRPSNQRNYNLPKRNFNASSRRNQKYDKYNTNISNVEENNYKNFYNNKEFSSSGNFGRFNTPRNSDGIEPWVKPPYSFLYGQASVMQQTPPNDSTDNSVKKSALLPHPPILPYSTSCPQDFQPVRQNDDFSGNWNNSDYHSYPPNNYQRRTSRGCVPMPASSGYYPRNHWRDKNRNNDWNNKRRNNSGHYEYRN